MFGARYLLPDRKPAVSSQDDPREYTVEMQVEADSPLAGLHVAGDVVAPRRRCQTGLVETTDNEMRRSSKSCAGTDVETKRLCIKAVVEIMEDLVERIHSQ